MGETSAISRASSPAKRAAGDVADYIAARASGGEADGFELLEKFGKRFDADPVELNILADGDIGYTVAVMGGEIGDGADLLAGEQAIGNANADHEERDGEAFASFAAGDTLAVALGVDAPRTEIGAEPFGRNGGMALASEIADFVEMEPGIFFALEAFDALGFGFFDRDLRHFVFFAIRYQLSDISYQKEQESWESASQRALADLEPRTCFERPQA